MPPHATSRAGANAAIVHCGSPDDLSFRCDPWVFHGRSKSLDRGSLLLIPILFMLMALDRGSLLLIPILFMLM
ncbi:hypothetical protein AB4156_44700, partial [Cupriavidus sp. 2MCAB6]|uniref:hypothetical protein n=1 Tax=Cupriavidus sp. 2MCAB6 TaxID=3232981 RepID=UPI003F935319